MRICIQICESCYTWHSLVQHQRYASVQLQLIAYPSIAWRTCFSFRRSSCLSCIQGIRGRFLPSGSTRPGILRWPVCGPASFSLSSNWPRGSCTQDLLFKLYERQMKATWTLSWHQGACYLWNRFCHLIPQLTTLPAAERFDRSQTWRGKILLQTEQKAFMVRWTDKSDMAWGLDLQCETHTVKSSS